MLANILNTNEIKNRAGTEVEFTRRNGGTGGSVEYSQVAETYNLPHRFKVAHQETGKGIETRRNSVIRFEKTVIGVSGLPRKIISQQKMEIPVGDLSSSDEPKNVLAEVISLCASLGANTTILYDCTGNGAICLIDGTL
jgi:hypothetical protein